MTNKYMTPKINDMVSELKPIVPVEELQLSDQITIEFNKGYSIIDLTDYVRMIISHGYELNCRMKDFVVYQRPIHKDARNVPTLRQWLNEQIEERELLDEAKRKKGLL